MDPAPRLEVSSRIRVGSVSYLNAKPLLYGLDMEARLDLHLAVPSRLIDGLRANLFDIALLPVIDYQRMDNLWVIPSGGIGCDGPTLTVRLFCAGPIERIHTLTCDVDSHTSVALARIILAERYGISPIFVDLSASDRQHMRPDPRTAYLLIGDKVVCEEPAGMPYQVDLGEAWKALTGLPFVFAVWTGIARDDWGDIPAMLTAARERGMEHLDEIVTTHALPRGWPPALAKKYVGHYLQYPIGPRQLQAIAHFHRLAGKYGMIPTPVQSLRVVD